VLSKKECVVCFGVNAAQPRDCPELARSDFPSGVKSIRDSLLKFNFRGDFLFWDKSYPEGCPEHAVSPHAFKPFCFYEAKKRGYDIVLWLDASVKIQKPIEPIFDLIKKDGYFFIQELTCGRKEEDLGVRGRNENVGEFCKDDALKTLGITREESFKIPSCWSAIVGLDLSTQIPAEFLRQWKEKALDGITFSGPRLSGILGWPQTASSDYRVRGHLSDQPAASVIAWKLGMRNWHTREFLFEFMQVDRNSVRILKEVFEDKNSRVS